MSTTVQARSLGQEAPPWWEKPSAGAQDVGLKGRWPTRASRSGPTASIQKDSDQLPPRNAGLWGAESPRPSAGAHRKSCSICSLDFPTYASPPVAYAVLLGSGTGSSGLLSQLASCICATCCHSPRPTAKPEPQGFRFGCYLPCLGLGKKKPFLHVMSWSQKITQVSRYLYFLILKFR